MRLSAVLTLVAFVALSAFVQAAPDLKPAETYVIIAGTLKWQDKKINTFSPTNRKDQELYDTLAKIGVPRDNMLLLLDEKATLDAIQKSVKDIGAKAKPGSTLLFYYCGHGSRLDNGKVALLNYDFNPKKIMTPADIGDWIAKEFKGERVFLLADCCMSGSLGECAAKLDKAKFKALSITSADAGNISTGNWTYTQTLLDALNGDPLLDANGDGDITLEELYIHLTREMKYREMQRCGVMLLGIPKTFRLASVDKNAKKPVIQSNFGLNDYVWAADKGVRRAGRIVGQEDKTLLVEFYNYTEKQRVKVEPGNIEKMEFRSYKADEAVMIEWGGQWWKAKILKVDSGFHLIRYDGYGAEWDEWVLANRIAVGDTGVLRKVQVKRNNDWYPATVLKKQDDKFYVSYDGFPAKLDEWVSSEKVRKPK